MDLRSLKLFLAVLDQGSITKASECVHVAQPALGLHIRKLEKELGLRLLERHSRGIRATEAGELLAQHAELILRHAEQAKAEMMNYSKVPSGTVVIGLTPIAREGLAVPLLERVSCNLPKVHLTIKEAMSEALVEYLLEGRIDAAIVYNSREGGDQLTYEPLASESMHFVYPLQNGRREGPTITLAEAIRHELILPTRSHLVRHEIARLASTIGVEPKIVHEVDSMAAIRDFVRCGLGYSIMPRGALANDSYADSIGGQMIVEPHIKRLMYLAYSRRRSILKTFEATLLELRAAVGAQMGRPNAPWQRLEPRLRLVRDKGARERPDPVVTGALSSSGVA